jgi:predicted TIM-barrel fold metal-dependent hydrolase
VTRAIDYLCNHFTQEHIQRTYLDEKDERETFERIGRAQSLRGYEPKEFMDLLGAIGVEQILVTAFKAWNYRDQVPFMETTVDEVVEASDAYPDRIHGLYGVIPHRAMNGVRELERLVRDHRFKGVHIHPHGFNLGPDHAYYFPYYAKCEELGIPAVISMGHTLEMMPMDNGRPSRLDTVALYFPGLKIVCGHTGWPWVNESIALASKHPNVYIGTSAYAPKYWQPEMIQFLNSRRGMDKVLWGTDWPLVRHEEALQQIEALGLKEDAKRKLLYDNSAQVFGLG